MADTAPQKRKGRLKIPLTLDEALKAATETPPPAKEGPKKRSGKKV